jgi:hypothetical protein
MILNIQIAAYKVSVLIMRIAPSQHWVEDKRQENEPNRPTTALACLGKVNMKRIVYRKKSKAD